MKGAFAFPVRSHAVERIGLPAVRDPRLNRLGADEAAWQEEVRRKAETTPELVPLLIFRDEGLGGHA